MGSVLVELPADALPALEEHARAIDRQGLAVTVLATAPEAEASGRVLSLELVGQDRPGIMREVTAVLAALGVNIDDLDTGVESGAWSGARLFRARARLHVPAGTDADALIAAREAISGEIMVDLTVT